MFFLCTGAWTNFPFSVLFSHAAGGTSHHLIFLSPCRIRRDFPFSAFFTGAASRTSFPVCFAGTAAGTVSACPRAAAASSPVFYYNPDCDTEPDQYHAHDHIICQFHTNTSLSRLSDKISSLRFTTSTKPTLLCKQQICRTAEKEFFQKRISSKTHVIKKSGAVSGTPQKPPATRFRTATPRRLPPEIRSEALFESPQSQPHTGYTAA